MSTITVVTSFAPDSWNLYSKRMLVTAIEHLPLNVEIVAYYNEEKPKFSHPRVQFVDNYAISNGVHEFLKRHGQNQRLWGKVPGQKDNFRHNVNSFSHKAYALYHAAHRTQSDILVWCDADVEFFADVPESFFDEVLPEPHYACFLDRGENYHIETGLYALRTNHSFHREFLERFIDYYRKDLFLKEKEYHDAHLMTQLVRKMREEGKISTWNLSPGYIGAGHPWMASRLVTFSDHKKGNLRKRAGKSFQEDLRTTRPESYWRSLPSRKDLK